MRCARPSDSAGVPDGGDLVEDLLVAPGEEGAAVDHHVHLVGAGRNRVPHVGQLDVQAGPAAGERGGDAGHVDAAALQFGRRDVSQVRVHADGGDHRRGRVGGVGALGLGAQRADLARRVLALQRGQVDHRDRGVERPSLGRGLDGPARQHGCTGLRPHPVYPGSPCKNPRSSGLVCVSADELIGDSFIAILTCSGSYLLRGIGLSPTRGRPRRARRAKKSWKFRLDLTAAVMPRSVDIAPCDHEGRDYHRVLPTRHQRRRALRPTGRRTPHQLRPPSPRHRAPAGPDPEPSSPPPTRLAEARLDGHQGHRLAGPAVQGPGAGPGGSGGARVAGW